MTLIKKWRSKVQGRIQGGRVKPYSLFLGIFSAFSLESNALKGPLWLAGLLAASKTRRRKHVETSGFLH